MKVFNIVAASAFALALTSTVLVADDDSDLQCISEKVVVSNVEILGFKDNWLGYKFQITNNLPFTMGGGAHFGCCSGQ